jgi:Mrp family chromosome partitioning ATPase
MGVSQVSHVSDAIGRLHAIGAKFTGVIANGVRTTAQEYAVGYVRGSKKRPGSAATAPVAAGR